MATTEIGTKPAKIRINLSKGGSFSATLESDDPWPTGFSVALVFSTKDGQSLSWPATMNTKTAVWDKHVAQVQEVIEGKYIFVRLHFIEADGDIIVCGTGDVNVV